jgi:hypothetical protein
VAWRVKVSASQHPQVSCERYVIIVPLWHTCSVDNDTPARHHTTGIMPYDCVALTNTQHQRHIQYVCLSGACDVPCTASTTSSHCHSLGVACKPPSCVHYSIGRLYMAYMACAWQGEVHNMLGFATSHTHSSAACWADTQAALATGTATQLRAKIASTAVSPLLGKQKGGMQRPTGLKHKPLVVTADDTHVCTL